MRHGIRRKGAPAFHASTRVAHADKAFAANRACCAFVRRCRLDDERPRSPRAQSRPDAFPLGRLLRGRFSATDGGVVLPLIGCWFLNLKSWRRGPLILARLSSRANGWSASLFFRAVVTPKMPGGLHEHELPENSFLRQWTRPAHRRTSCSHPAAFGLGQVPARLQARRDHDDGLRLLLDRLRARRPPARRRGRQPDARDRLSGEPRHGLPQGLGSADAAAARPIARRRRCCATSDGELEPVDWDDAHAASSRRASRRSRTEHGPESVAFLSTGQIATEEMAFLGALAKFGMGMVHGDGNTRQCMATAVVAYKQSFGFDAPPYTYADFEESDVHRLRRLEPVHRPSDHVGARAAATRTSREIIVVDPRKTETAMAATQHLRAAAEVAT